MQEFCKELCLRNDIEESQFPAKTVPASREELEKIFRTVASATGKTMFDRLSRGPRQGLDRMARTLADGSNTDIYGLVLHALATLQPGIETIDYERLRSAIRDISTDQIP